MDREKVVEWVQKLMQKAMDPAATEAEKDAFQSKAEEFMARYKISMMEATTADEIKGHEMLREDVFFAIKGKTRWGYDLAWGIAPIFECTAVRWRGTQKLTFFGFPEDVESCVYFFRTLQFQIVFAVDATGYSTVKQKNSYATGMVVRVLDRIERAYARVKEIVPADTKELMVVKQKAVDNFVEKEIGKVRTTNMSHNIDHDAYRAGVKDGGKLDIASNRERVDHPN